MNKEKEEMPMDIFGIMKELQEKGITSIA